MCACVRNGQTYFLNLRFKRSRKVNLGTYNVKSTSIPESYRKLPKHIFKKKIQALLIVTLETLDSYADISTLISEIKKASKV